MSAAVKKALAEIFESPSDDEDFLGFGDTHSSRKPALQFRSKFITEELAQIFMDTDSEEEFEGFSDSEEEESSQRRSWVSSKVLESEQDSDDIGFYSDDDSPAPQRRQSSGLCVAFRFPVRRSSTHERPELKKSSVTSEAGVPPVRTRKRRGGQAEAPVECEHGKKRPEITRNESEEEDELTEADLQIMSKRAKNIQENKAMLAKLFAELNSLPALSPKTTPSKRKQSAPRKHVSEVQSERRNPSRRARPPEHFGLEKELEIASKPRGRSLEIDLNKLMEVNMDLREDGPRQKRKCRKRVSVRMPEDITEEELENVADRAKDKILDKENGSTCHQCRQKTLDTKTECRNPYCQGVKGKFCGPCLRNRYGEDVRTALLDPTWECPLCRGVCNCSLCRKRDGRCATGALTHLAKYNGFHNVKEYLESLQKNLE